MNAQVSNERLSLFQRVADWVSAAMGRPTNIAVWLVAVVAWTLVFALGGPHVANGSWLPSWFTSQGFNFPLNLITTIAELFIGFLVAAAANRSERHLEMTLAQIEAIEASIRGDIAANTALTEEVHKNTQLIDDLHRHLAGMTNNFQSLQGGDVPPPA
jgi:low affinity Fe/Cu permease